jgi:hypothetical protein
MESKRFGRRNLLLQKKPALIRLEKNGQVIDSNEAVLAGMKRPTSGALTGESFAKKIKQEQFEAPRLDRNQNQSGYIQINQKIKEERNYQVVQPNTQQYQVIKKEPMPVKHQQQTVVKQEQKQQQQNGHVQQQQQQQTIRLNPNLQQQQIRVHQQQQQRGPFNPHLQQQQQIRFQQQQQLKQQQQQLKQKQISTIEARKRQQRFQFYRQYLHSQLRELNQKHLEQQKSMHDQCKTNNLTLDQKQNFLQQFKLQKEEHDIKVKQVTQLLDKLKQFEKQKVEMLIEKQRLQMNNNVVQQQQQQQQRQVVYIQPHPQLGAQYQQQPQYQQQQQQQYHQQQYYQQEQQHVTPQQHGYQQFSPPLQGQQQIGTTEHNVSPQYIHHNSPNQTISPNQMISPNQIISPNETYYPEQSNHLQMQQQYILPDQITQTSPTSSQHAVSPQNEYQEQSSSQHDVSAQNDYKEHTSSQHDLSQQNDYQDHSSSQQVVLANHLEGQHQETMQQPSDLNNQPNNQFQIDGNHFNFEDQLNNSQLFNQNNENEFQLSQEQLSDLFPNEQLSSTAEQSRTAVKVEMTNDIWAELFSIINEN